MTRQMTRQQEPSSKRARPETRLPTIVRGQATRRNALRQEAPGEEPEQQWPRATWCAPALSVERGRRCPPETLPRQEPATLERTRLPVDAHRRALHALRRSQAARPDRRPASGPGMIQATSWSKPMVAERRSRAELLVGRIAHVARASGCERVRSVLAQHLARNAAENRRMLSAKRCDALAVRRVGDSEASTAGRPSSQRLEKCRVLSRHRAHSSRQRASIPACQHD